MIKFILYIFVGLLLVHWLTAGHDNIINPEPDPGAPISRNNNLEDTK